MNYIKTHGVSVSYDRKQVLSNIYLNIEPGHLYGLVGPNGAGKSTLVKAILGLVDLDDGSVQVGDYKGEKWRKHLAYVPQRDEVDHTFPASVMDVVLFGRYVHKPLFSRMNETDFSMAEEALKKMSIYNLRDRQIGTLSGGQEQRMYIARALCQQADIFLLDEPFVGVDVTTENIIIETLRELADEGKTIVVIHHDLVTVKNYFDRVILLNQRLIGVGDVDDVLTEKNIRLAYGAQLTILQKAALLKGEQGM